MKKISEKNILSRPFNITLYQDRETRLWVAHCLEFDTIEDGKTPEQAITRLFKIMRSNVRDAIKRNAIKDLFHFAPSEYWEQAVVGKPVEIKEYVPAKKLAPYHIYPQKIDLKLVA